MDLIDELARRAAEAVRMEDYCHAVEHSIEFQIVFLQHLYGENVGILPILCGPFVSSLFEGGLPEKTERVAKFFDVAGEIFAREAERLFFVLGVDMAHMGRRYGDQRSLAANEGEMLSVKDRDHERIRQLEFADARAYWDLIQQNEDDLKWCGSAPLYTFLRTVPGVSGRAAALSPVADRSAQRGPLRRNEISKNARLIAEAFPSSGPLALDP